MYIRTYTVSREKGATMFLTLTLLNTDDSQILLPTDLAIHF